MTLTPHPDAPPPPIPPICQHCEKNDSVVILHIIKGETAKASWWCERCDTCVHKIR
jgi:protein-arginine kinase activator protein McsA